jgi:hypothetical protein
MPSDCGNTALEGRKASIEYLTDYITGKYPA